MLAESILYLSTCALKLWRQMVSAAQKHLDKFMRPLVHKWMQNYQAGMYPPSSLTKQICWSSTRGVNHRKKLGSCSPQIAFPTAAVGDRMHCEVDHWSNVVRHLNFKAVWGSKKKANSSKEINLLHIVRVVSEAVYNSKAHKTSWKPLKLKVSQSPFLAPLFVYCVSDCVAAWFKNKDRDHPKSPAEGELWLL